MKKEAIISRLEKAREKCMEWLNDSEAENINEIIGFEKDPSIYFYKKITGEILGDVQEITLFMEDKEAYVTFSNLNGKSKAEYLSVEEFINLISFNPSDEDIVTLSE